MKHENTIKKLTRKFIDKISNDPDLYSMYCCGWGMYVFKNFFSQKI